MIEISKHKTIHFLGIGGAGMCPIAQILLEMGFKVSGTDLKETVNTVRLKELGATIYYGHDPKNLRQADIVVRSSAISLDNSELVEAEENGLPIFKRAEMLQFLMSHFQSRIAIAGTHGKTTTTGMIATALNELGENPTYVVGSEIMGKGNAAHFGDETYCVAEADESDGSFLVLDPTLSIITNIEADHMDYFKTMDSLKDHFNRFIENTLKHNDGVVVYNHDDALVDTLIKTHQRPDACWSFGFEDGAKVQAKQIVYESSGTRFQLWLDGQDCGDVVLQVVGRHNVANALATIAVLASRGFTAERIKPTLYAFTGTKRRFQKIGTFNDVDIYDDYAHHPTEIATTLAGIKNSFNRRLIAIFQPHRFTRTKELADQFPLSFDAADIVIISKIYSAHEAQIEGVTGAAIVEKMKAHGHKCVYYIEHKSEIVKQLIPMLKPQDMVVTMGAGDIYKVAKEILTQLKVKAGPHLSPTGDAH